MVETGLQPECLRMAAVLSGHRKAAVNRYDSRRLWVLDCYVVTSWPCGRRGGGLYEPSL